MKTLPHIADKLKAAMGLDMATVGASLIERVVRERMSAGHRRRQPLPGALQSAAELQALIELAVVPETWFFRDREAMLAAARLAANGWPHSRRPVRILSLPCSTGEEPYSLAMALLDAGVMPAQFVIDAYDIRTRSLEIAAAGSMGATPSGAGPGLPRPPFPARGARLAIARAIRQQVRLPPATCWRRISCGRPRPTISFSAATC
jgi:chemotaxis protein methyltransferase WspC